MNKQIEEMAKLSCTAFDGNCHNCPFDFYPPCPPKASAEALYNAGYRKQTEGEWIEEYRDWDMPPFYYIDYTCSICGQREQDKSPYCRWCGAKMKGGE